MGPESGRELRYSLVTLVKVVQVCPRSVRAGAPGSWESLGTDPPGFASTKRAAGAVSPRWAVPLGENHARVLRLLYRY